MAINVWKVTSERMFLAFLEKWNSQVEKKVTRTKESYYYRGSLVAYKEQFRNGNKRFMVLDGFN
jgi:hypothetical protein